MNWTGVLLWAVTLTIIGNVISGILYCGLHHEKGYDGGFWIGFLLGIIGLIFAAGLPDSKQYKITNSTDGKTFITPTDEDFDSVEDVTSLCPECGYQTFPEDEECPNCGHKLR